MSIEVKFLDTVDNGGYAIHDWAEHQPWAYHAEERSERARAAVRVRFAPKPDKGGIPEGPRKGRGRPTLEEVKAYQQERGSTIDPQAFLDYNETKGWVTGKTNSPIKNWQAAFRTWENLEFQKQAPALLENELAELRKRRAYWEGKIEHTQPDSPNLLLFKENKRIVEEKIEKLTLGTLRAYIQKRRLEVKKPEKERK